MSDPFGWARDPIASVREGATPPAPVAAPPERVPFWDAVGRGARDQVFNSNEGGREAVWLDLLAERHAEIERITGRPFSYSDDMERSAFGSDALYDATFDPYAPDAAGQALQRRRSADDYEAELDRLKAQFPALARLQTRDQLRTTLDARLKGFRASADEGARSGVAGAVGSFVGGSGAAMIDLPNLIAGAATGGVGLGRPLLTRMGQQALVGAATEVVQVPARSEAAREFRGPAYDGREAVADVIGGAAGAAGFEAVVSGARYAGRALSGRLTRSADPYQRAIGEQIDALNTDEALIGAGGQDFDAGRAALDRGDLPPQSPPERDFSDLFDAPVSAPVGRSQPELPAATGDGLIAADYNGRRIWSGRFDPLAVETDAARFQYKAGGDGEGVTGRLQGVERWDATASGKAILFEDVDGRRFVADGHQRRGLAARLAREGFGEEARLDAYLLRAEDGWSAREARIVAALKNVKEGSGQIMDAAKLFRDAPGTLRDRSLPVTGEFIQQARQLAGLSEPAFRAVVNGVIPERYGAVLGEVAGDRPDIQADLVALLQRAQPSNVEGARALVQEAMLDDFIATEGVQTDLFGGLPREATVIARGQIREAVMATLRRDTRLYGQLVRNADAIEAGGNVLTRDQNAQRVALDRAAHELVSKLSLRAGEIGEAFQAAATEVTLRKTTAGKVAKGLVARIRAAVAAGDRLDDVRAEILTATPPSAPARAAGAAFGEVGGPGQRAQMEAKPEDALFEDGAARQVTVYHGSPLTGLTRLEAASRTDDMLFPPVVSLSTDRRFAEGYAGETGQVYQGVVDVSRLGDFRRADDVNKLIAFYEKEGTPLDANDLEAARHGAWRLWENPDFWAESGWRGAFVREEPGRADADTLNISVLSGDDVSLGRPPEDGPPPGLFDDLPETDGLDRAITHLRACAPGKAA